MTTTTQLFSGVCDYWAPMGSDMTYSDGYLDANDQPCNANKRLLTKPKILADAVFLGIPIMMVLIVMVARDPASEW